MNEIFQRVEFVNAEVLRVGPDEVLIIRLNADSWGDHPTRIESLLEGLERIGLAQRALILSCDPDEIEMAVVKKEPSIVVAPDRDAPDYASGETGDYR